MCAVPEGVRWVNFGCSEADSWNGCLGVGSGNGQGDFVECALTRMWEGVLGRR